MNMEFEIEVGADAEDIGDIQAFQDSCSDDPSRRERHSSGPKHVSLKIPHGDSAPGAMLAMEDMFVGSDFSGSPSRVRRFSDGSQLSSRAQPAPEIMSLCDGRTDGKLASFLTGREPFGSSDSFGSMEDMGSISRKAHVRAVVQQCTGAKLSLPSASLGAPPDVVEVGGQFI